MPSIRAVAVAALVALDVSAAAAQQARGFRDSWFWGAKGGAMMYQVMSDTTGSAIGPMFGIDWLITRSKGGLYVSFDQTLFDQWVLVSDSTSFLDTLPRQVNLSGMRRFSLVGMLFPLQTSFMQPYVGLGVAMHHIAKAEAVGTYRNSTQQNLVESTIQQFRSSASPLLMIGTQLKLPFVSIFGQVTATAADRNFFLFTGSNWRTTGEAGIRINAGKSIDKMR